MSSRRREWSGAGAEGDRLERHVRRGLSDPRENPPRRLAMRDGLERTDGWPGDEAVGAQGPRGGTGSAGGAPDAVAGGGSLHAETDRPPPHEVSRGRGLTLRERDELWPIG
jgi:hypothetical protein